jgi:hypothetical protein
MAGGEEVRKRFGALRGFAGLRAKKGTGSDRDSLHIDLGAKHSLHELYNIPPNIIQEGHNFVLLPSCNVYTKLQGVSTRI